MNRIGMPVGDDQHLWRASRHINGNHGFTILQISQSIHQGSFSSWSTKWTAMRIEQKFNYHRNISLLQYLWQDIHTKLTPYWESNEATILAKIIGIREKQINNTQVDRSKQIIFLSVRRLTVDDLCITWAMMQLFPLQSWVKFEQLKNDICIHYLEAINVTIF